jgi:hypothetical protein
MLDGKVLTFVITILYGPVAYYYSLMGVKMIRTREMIWVFPLNIVKRLGSAIIKQSGSFSYPRPIPKNYVILFGISCVGIGITYLLLWVLWLFLFFY